MRGPQVHCALDGLHTSVPSGALPVEQCDDGNTMDGDCCCVACVNEICGDGMLTPVPCSALPAEECDDGINIDGDCFSAACMNEIYPQNKSLPSDLAVTCGKTSRSSF